jgi:hypothetical protein
MAEISDHERVRTSSGRIRRRRPCSFADMPNWWGSGAVRRLERRRMRGMRRTLETRFVWRLAVAAGIGVLIVDLLYLQLVLFGQGAAPPSPSRVAFIATWIALSGAAAVVGGVASGAGTRAVLLGVATAGLLVMGVVGAFSVGIPLLLATMVVGGSASVAADVAGIGVGRRTLGLFALGLLAAGLMAIGLAWT